MLKKFRVAISIVLFSLITLYFLDFAALLPEGFHVLAHIQLVPAILAFNVVIILVLVLLTLAFGRIYCSSICPMGIYQDIVAWISKRFGKKKKKYTYSKAKNILRWTVLVASIIGVLLGFMTLLELVDPYSAYGRMIVSIFKPIYMAGNNVLESIFTSFGNYTFYKAEIVMLSSVAFLTGILTLFIIGFLSWKYGRTYCNTICPVGTILGFLGKYSFFKVRIDIEKCNNCGACARYCKASCINSKEYDIDYSRCVDCFNCLGSCKQNALSFSFAKKETSLEKTTPSDTGRRQFLLVSISTAVTVPVVMVQDKVNSLAGVTKHARQHPISPPGSVSADHLLHHCTSCLLCVSRCPSHVLKPSFMEYGAGGIMQPMMYFEKGFCNYDCTICANICPNKALKPLTKEEKHLTQVGRVVFVEDICVVHTNGTNCGACAEHCPTQAVTMIPYKNGLTIPHINPDICVGCGGCEYICPVRPYRAIYVEGNVEHLQAQAFKEGKKEKIEIDDFGF